MKSATLVIVLTSLTIAMAVAAPIVVFGFLYVLQVQPERAAALEVRNQLEAARGELNRRRALVKSQAAGTAASAGDEFDARTAEGDRIGDVAHALTAALNSPAVGRVSNVSIATGASGDDPIDSMVGVFSRKVMHAPVTVTFDAKYEEIGRFFWNLRVLPTTFDLRSVELTRIAAPPAGLMRARVSLLAFHRPGAMRPRVAPQPQKADVVTTPPSTRDPSGKQPRAEGVADGAVATVVQPDPVVTGILFSSGRRVALVDGRIVRQGDRLGAGVVQSIEPDAVVIAGPGGRTRRLEIERRLIGTRAR